METTAMTDPIITQRKAELAALPSTGYTLVRGMDGGATITLAAAGDVPAILRGLAADYERQAVLAAVKVEASPEEVAAVRAAMAGFTATDPDGGFRRIAEAVKRAGLVAGV